MFSGEEVPEYEINSQTVDHLYRMAQDSETREREAEVTIEDFEQKAEEYAAESECTRRDLFLSILFHGKEYGVVFCDCGRRIAVHVTSHFNRPLSSASSFHGIMS